MLYNLLLPYIHTSSIANLFHYISFRSGLAILLSFILTLVFGPILINKLKDIHKNGQPIRDDGPITHFAKAGTPTMGGLMIIGPVLFVSLLLTDLKNPYIWVVLFIMISFAGIGYLDDITKIKYNNHKGISGRARMLFQVIITIIVCLLIQHISKNPTNNTIAIPYFKKLIIDLGYFYIPFAVFIIVGAANAVNLTDGLDGLAIVPIAIASSSFALISYLVGNTIYSNYLQLTYLPHVGELTVFCCAIVGGALGFLWFNCQPAEIFMGDTGSLSLGGILGTISVITKHEIVFAIIGGLFVIETLSVIIQVYYFKATGGKRIFKMAPLHHHFEHKGWQESKVVIRFWIMAIMFALLGLSSLKLR